MDNQFLINDRFRVNEAVNTVTDIKTGTETRLEPRLMKLLMLLVAHKGEVVTRQHIITDIWNDYGNADEGLSQAVSFLRKIFGDDDKQLIRTIPKKGYVLDAVISAGISSQPVKHRTIPPKLRMLYIVIPIIILLVVAIIYFLQKQPASNGPVEPPGSIIDTTYQYREMRDSINR